MRGEFLRWLLYKLYNMEPNQKELKLIIFAEHRNELKYVLKIYYNVSI